MEDHSEGAVEEGEQEHSVEEGEEVVRVHYRGLRFILVMAEPAVPDSGIACWDGVRRPTHYLREAEIRQYIIDPAHQISGFACCWVRRPDSYPYY